MPTLVAQNPNVAFDFDHWEECEEDSPFSKGEMDRPCFSDGGEAGQGREIGWAQPVLRDFTLVEIGY